MLSITPLARFLFFLTQSRARGIRTHTGDFLRVMSLPVGLVPRINHLTYGCRYI